MKIVCLKHTNLAPKPFLTTVNSIVLVLLNYETKQHYPTDGN